MHIFAEINLCIYIPRKARIAKDNVIMTADMCFAKRQIQETQFFLRELRFLIFGVSEIKKLTTILVCSRFLRIV